MLKFIAEYWQQTFFACIGLVFLAFSFYCLWTGDVAGASATFAMAFFSFIYANMSRFKRFKGLGFEAELWEDKKKEAEQLIDRLKAVVSVYTREIILGKVKQGRYGGAAKWSENWRLFDELVENHLDLGQDIDFTELKKIMDQYFLFDMISPLYAKVRDAVWNGRASAREVISAEFGQPIEDVVGHSSRVKQLQEIPKDIKDIFELSQKENLAAVILNWGNVAKRELEDNFSVTIDLDIDVVKTLQKLSGLYNSGPLKVTEELIALSNGH